MINKKTLVKQEAQLTARCFVLLSISLSHPKLLKIIQNNTLA